MRHKYNKEEIGEAGWSTSVLALCHFCKEEELDGEEKQDEEKVRRRSTQNLKTLNNNKLS